MSLIDVISMKANSWTSSGIFPLCAVYITTKAAIKICRFKSLLWPGYRNCRPLLSGIKHLDPGGTKSAPTCRLEPDYDSNRISKLIKAPFSLRVWLDTHESFAIHFLFLHSAIPFIGRIFFVNKKYLYHVFVWCEVWWWEAQYVDFVTAWPFRWSSGC